MFKAKTERVGNIKAIFAHITHKTAKLSKEQQALQQKVNKLKQDAAGLQDLIKQAHGGRG